MDAKHPDAEAVALASVDSSPKMVDYSTYSDRDLCVALSRNLKEKDEARDKLVDLEARATEMREKGEPIIVAEELGVERAKYLTAVRAVIHITAEQKKRSKTNHRSRAIKRGKARR